MLNREIDRAPSRASRFRGKSYLVAMLCAGCVLAAPSWSWANDTAKVEQLSEEAMAKYEAADYAGAIAIYLQAYKVQPAGALLYNVATIYDRKLNQRDLAIEYYRRFLSASDAEPDLVRKAVARVQTLEEARMAATEATAATPNEPGSATQTDAKGAPVATATAKGPLFTRESVRNYGYVATALGVVGIGIGLAYGYKARQARDDASGLCDDKFCYSDEGQKASRDANSRAQKATIFTAVGLGAAAAGIAMIVLTRASPEPATAAPLSFVPAVSERGLSLVLRGAF